MISAAGLLDIEVIPLEFQTITTRPTLEVVSHTRGRFEVTREGGTYEAVKMQADSAHFTRQARIQAYNSYRRFSFADDKVSAGKARKNYNLPSLANAVANANKSYNSTPISKLAFQYRPQEISFDWVREEKIMKGRPGKVEFMITQYPDVLIEYLGGPIYCPPSSAPGYEESAAIDMVV